MRPCKEMESSFCVRSRMGSLTPARGGAVGNLIDRIETGFVIDSAEKKK